MALHMNASLRERWTRDEAGWSFEFPSGWNQGRSIFGGLSAAAAVALGHRNVNPDRELRTITIHLFRPMNHGLVRGSVQVLREGRNISFIEVILSQNDKKVAQATLVFVITRPEGLAVEANARPAQPFQDDLPSVTRESGFIPEFVQHVDMRWAEGSPPFSGAEQARFEGYCRFRVPAGNAEGLVALLDVWPCPSLSCLDGPAPASTVSWTAHLIQTPDDLSDWCYYTYETIVSGGGYHTSCGHMYGPDGALIGWTEQLVAIYE